MPATMWPEDVAAAMGVSLRQVHKKLLESRTRAGQDLPLRAGDLPLPESVQRRQVSNGHHQVTVTSPRWAAPVITAWLAQRPGRGAPGRARTREAAS
jgi:hypothetical protein